jgi:hypothetical protein
MGWIAPFAPSISAWSRRAEGAAIAMKTHSCRCAPGRARRRRNSCIVVDPEAISAFHPHPTSPARGGAKGRGRDDLSSNRHPALHYWCSMIPAFAGTSLFRKPVSTPAFARACFSGSCSRLRSLVHNRDGEWPIVCLDTEALRRAAAGVNLPHPRVGALDVAAKSAAIEQRIRAPILLQLARYGL